MNIKLIIGLGNPDVYYSNTLHNAGKWWLYKIVENLGGCFFEEKKFTGKIAKIINHKRKILFFSPNTFMNETGNSIINIIHFYKIKPNEILVGHDDLDFPCGKIKLKYSGGNGGHNGLRNIISYIGSNFWRIRIGIGHPGYKKKVQKYVLQKVCTEKKNKINEAIIFFLQYIHLILEGKIYQAMQEINSNIKVS